MSPLLVFHWLTKSQGLLLNIQKVEDREVLPYLVPKRKTGNIWWRAMMTIYQSKSHPPTQLFLTIRALIFTYLVKNHYLSGCIRS
jgi:cytochrome bd-type quinol oxidase subunit 2